MDTPAKDSIQRVSAGLSRKWLARDIRQLVASRNGVVVTALKHPEDRTKLFRRLLPYNRDLTDFIDATHGLVTWSIRVLLLAVVSVVEHKFGLPPEAIIGTNTAVALMGAAPATARAIASRRA